MGRTPVRPGPITVVLDVETISSFHELARLARTSPVPAVAGAAAIAEMAKKADRDPETFAALAPPLARVVVAGLYQVETKRSLCLFDGEAFGTPPDFTPPEKEHQAQRGERALLERLNAILARATRIVTFNGRAFDLAVLVLRMLAHDIAPCTTLLHAWREHRYRPNVHVDVRDQLTNYGATSNGPGTSLRAFSLGLGLPDPKPKGDGAAIADLVRKGDAASACEYCLGDVGNTAVIYERWLDACGVS